MKLTNAGTKECSAAPSLATGSMDEYKNCRSQIPQSIYQNTLTSLKIDSRFFFLFVEKSFDESFYTSNFGIPS